MITLKQIRSRHNQILVLGNHPQIIQSILDFDYYCNKKEGSVIGIVTGKVGFAKYFFGRQEVLIPTIESSSDFASLNIRSISNLWFLNLLSSRRVLSSTLELISSNFVGGAIFAENVPELHALELIQTVTLCNRDTAPMLVGPASVGLLVPGALKLGPLGGITPDQIRDSKLFESGGLAIMSASGGMTNELINIAASAGHRLSFALSFGGDRFPIFSPRDAFLLAEADPQTKGVLYYGELGGEDEYELIKLKEASLFTKPVVAHIAGTVASLFPDSPQFGHAKAKADKQRTMAISKRTALNSAGFLVSQSFTEFISLVNKLK